MLLRFLAPVVLVVGALAVQDAAVDALAGDRWCLSEQVATQSPELADLVCFSVGVDGPQPGTPYSPPGR